MGREGEEGDIEVVEKGGRRRGEGGMDEERVGKMKKTERTRWNVKKVE